MQVNRYLLLQSFQDLALTDLGRCEQDPAVANQVLWLVFPQISAANGVAKLIIGQNGILSTPAVSALIRARRTNGMPLHASSTHFGCACEPCADALAAAVQAASFSPPRTTLAERLVTSASSSTSRTEVELLTCFVVCAQGGVHAHLTLELVFTHSSCS